MKFFRFFILFLLLGSHFQFVSATTTELEITAQILDINQIRSIAQSSEDIDKSENGVYDFGIQIGGIPLLIFNVYVDDHTSEESGSRQMEYILNKDGKGLIFIDQETFYKDQVGTIQISY